MLTLTFASRTGCQVNTRIRTVFQRKQGGWSPEPQPIFTACSPNLNPGAFFLAHAKQTAQLPCSSERFCGQVWPMRREQRCTIGQSLAEGIKKPHDTLQLLLPPVPTKKPTIAMAGRATCFGEPRQEPPYLEQMPSKQDMVVAAHSSGVSKLTCYCSIP